MNKDRHRIEQYYFMYAQMDDIRKDLNIEGWDNNLHSLAGIIQQQAPDWTRLDIKKCTLTFDNASNKLVSKKYAELKIGRLGKESMCTKVDQDLTKNGKIPDNIIAFFAQKQK